MITKRHVEVFSAGCIVCEEVIELVNKIACPSCDVEVKDMKDPQVAARARSLGIKVVPSVVIDGRIAECCAQRRPDEATLRSSGLGQSVY